MLGETMPGSKIQQDPLASSIPEDFAGPEACKAVDQGIFP